MNYMVAVPQKRFDIGMLRWLFANVSEQNVKWKVESDCWERRLVYFTNEDHSKMFKNFFSL